MWLYFGGRAVCFAAMKTFTLHDSSVSYISFLCLCLNPSLRRWVTPAIELFCYIFAGNAVARRNAALTFSTARRAHRSRSRA